MKKTLLHILFLLWLTVSFAQNEQLAQNYYERGEFEKARISYEELLKSQPGNGVYFQRLIDCYQQLEAYEVAEKTIIERLQRYKQANLYVELGYNYQLKKDNKNAEENYNLALDKIRENPSNVYTVASTFERKVLLEKALEAYELALSIDIKARFNYQMGLIYGQLGKQDLMVERFLEEMYLNPQNTVLIQNQFSRFMSDNPEDTFNVSLRKALLSRAQKNQDIFWNQMLSWFFTQQKEYGKAFVQERAIYRREQHSFDNIVNLAQLTIEEGEENIATEILNFILENTDDNDLQIQSHYYLTKMQIKKSVPKDYNEIQTAIELLIKKFGISPYTLSIQLLQADFLTFKQRKPEQGKAVLHKAMELPLNKFQEADVKMELADILLYEEKFNQALIYYTQIEEDLKNDVLGHEASLKAAKTSYFKTDFDWALTQLKVLKSASTQLIANDALELFLLINDNTNSDSTQTALKKFAKADFLNYQNKDREALVLLKQILEEHKDEEIEDETLLKIGTIYEELKEFNDALAYYKQIIDNHPESIYRDEAYFYSAEIYNRDFQEPEKAKPLYEAILFNHQDSIHFVEARKKFRLLRGDTNL
ncbi:MAG: tetratricopeptide repeat protein [Flavobacteriaceae bacterium]|nr:tetratricopeptide repeat protein [Flavobacteriaceae bacterium]